MERADPVSVDAFAIELLVHEYKIGKGYLEFALAVLSGWDLLRAEFLSSKGREMRLIITMIANSRQIVDGFFDSDIPSMLLPFLLTMINFFQVIQFCNEQLNY
jgi:hypothetical protein